MTEIERERGIQSAGRAALVDWMDADKATRGQTFVAKKVGVSQPAVRAWIRGDSRPEPHLRPALELLCGIPSEAWEIPEERQKREDAMARIRAEAAAEDAERSGEEHRSGDHGALAGDTGTDGGAR